MDININADTRNKWLRRFVFPSYQYATVSYTFDDTLALPYVLYTCLLNNGRSNNRREELSMREYSFTTFDDMCAFLRDYFYDFEKRNCLFIRDFTLKKSNKNSRVII